MTDERLNEAVGANIRKLRQAVNMSQTELASHVDESFRQQTILKIEKGSRPLKLTEAVAIAEALSVSVEYLYQPDVEPAEKVSQVLRQLIDTAESARASIASLEYLRRSLAFLVEKHAGELPAQLREHADDWAGDSLASDVAARGVRDFEDSPIGRGGITAVHTDPRAAWGDETDE
ncbi:helix-turn-helix transcriptional regulator [Solicola gregarius]|uniref:Helix-turn-helix domain-containing protein n=1 Tax=Solicola gregarius TaxID=2908642 RepID=A0AA46YM50_9ACTN|nr:helix-turn-helix transcriptional regulator [Solicola gregarius]UYM05458.1 helix-turn-helix domain-containing protein [Solicola gregarius]